MLQEWQKRVVEEKMWVDRKAYLLRSFCHGYDGACKLSRAEQELVSKQLHVMIAYSDILAARIALFSAGEDEV